MVCDGAEDDNNFLLSPNETSKFHNIEYDSSAPKDEFDSDDIDSDIDPALMEKIDR